ncbi:MAG: VWA domain-containing protein, partial [Neisseriaceae bacterium]|nr:VWA domain-containing protein [Neisseriaceae bacterium]
MKTNRRTFSFSLLAISVLSATSAMAADTDSPFATPLHLSNPGMSKTVTITKNETIPKVATWDVSNTSTSLYEKNKPNIMLYLDDSGSMIGEKENSLKRVLPDLIREYGDKASWGLSWMESINSSSNAHNTEIGLTDDYQRIINAISNSRYNGGTPFLTGYVNAVDKFAKTPIPLSCTNNYIIAMTDGSANSDRYQDVNPRISSSEVWQAANVSEYPKLTVSGKTFEPYQFGEDGGSYNQRWDGWAGDYYSDTWGTSYYLWYSRKGQVKSNSLYGLSSSEVDYLDSIFLKQLSDPLLKNTNIKTYTVAYGMGTSSGDRRTKHMLKKGAIGEGMYNGNPTYFDANDEQGLRDAFARMFEEMTKQSNDGTQPVAIVDGSPSTVKPTVGESTGASSVHTEESKHAIAAPTVTGDDTQIRPEENVALWLPIGEEKGLRSAELRFYKPDYDAQDPKAYLPT